MFETKNKLRLKKGFSVALVVILLMMFMLPNFADVSAESDVETSEIIELNLNMIRNSFIENSSDIRKIDDGMDEIGVGLDTYDKNIYYLLVYFNKVSGSNDLRTGKYYEYAYPKFVAIENYKAQLENLERTKNIAEAKLSNAADQYVFNYKLLTEKIDLYEQMILRTEQTYANIQNQASLGLLTEKDVTNAKLELENLKYEKEKLELNKEVLKDTMLSMSTFDADAQYTIQLPTFMMNEFKSEDINLYYDSAIQNSIELASLSRTLSAMEVEGSYIDMYKLSILKSDQLEYKTRLSDTKQSVEDKKNEIYNLLRDELSEINRIESEIENANTQIEYDEVMLERLEQMEQLGLVIDTDRLGYQLKVFQSELQKKSLETERYLTGQKIELLVYYGIEL